MKHKFASVAIYGGVHKALHIVCSCTSSPLDLEPLKVCPESSLFHMSKTSEEVFRTGAEQRKSVLLPRLSRRLGVKFQCVNICLDF